MKIEVKVPPVGESVATATLGKWLVKNADLVKKEQEILELETDKVDFHVPAPASGRVEILVTEGMEVKIGQLVAYIDAEAAMSPDTEVAPFPEAAADAPSQTPKPAEAEKPQPPPHEVEPSADTDRQSRVKMSTIRRTIANRLVQATHEAAYVTTFNEINMEHVISAIKKYHDEFMQKHGVKLGYMSFLVKATTQALKSFPDINTFVDGDSIVFNHYYDIGVAVSVDGGLIVPVIKNADRLSFAEIELKIKELAQKAKAKTITLDELQGGTFSITNGGIFGSMLSTPIPNFPQTAILGMHAIKDRPYVVDGALAVKPIMYVALTYDHRVIDGREGVLFLMSIKNLIEDPERLMFEI